MTDASLSLPRVRTRRWVDRAASVAFLGVLALLGALLGAFALGYQALVVRSDSMQPTFGAGDVILVQRAQADHVRRGDVITFADPSRAGESVTHRVVRKRPQRRRIAFVTRGDANTGVERWTITRDGTVGRYVVAVPRAGYAVAWFATPRARIVLITFASLLLGAIALRSIWAG